MKLGNHNHTPPPDSPRQKILAEIERLEMEAKTLQRNASAYHHWNNNSIFRNVSRIEPVHVSGPVNQINDRIRDLKAELAELEE